MFTSDDYRRGVSLFGYLAQTSPTQMRDAFFCETADGKVTSHVLKRSGEAEDVMGACGGKAFESLASRLGVQGTWEQDEPPTVAPPLKDISGMVRWRSTVRILGAYEKTIAHAAFNCVYRDVEGGQAEVTFVAK